MNTLKERISKKELMKMYGVDRTTIESWVKERGLPMIEISSHKKYVRREDLIEFENKMIKNKIGLK
ncbi:hypothetical protein SLH46_18565 [Draconibacterium sp. IB214405]|uniref:helix-turn-helix domain-containing protein n=1 Tax=Draconibacterium sp. IB214405 TaxID=3097352 RepID=UPI002A1772ED|nr:helix-turn-helix domain-containing protein [Draconibacterium sp. IB214405]MDX8341209.1 hypothetical protein [Draconibacterium sp. IB214405]